MIVKDKVYEGDVGTAIIIDCGVDLTGATGTVILVQKPNRITVEWNAALYTIDGKMNYLRYVTVAGDLIAGVYKMQPKLVLGDWSGLGHTVELEVFRKFM